MLIIGLLLVLLTAAGAIVLVAYNSSGGPEQMIVLFGRDIVSVNPLEAFISGIALTLIFALGLWMVVTTERRRRAARSQYREARREARVASKEARVATKERDKLADELAKERETGPAWTTPQGAADQPTSPPPEQAPPAQTPSKTRSIGRHFRRTPRTDGETADDKSTTPGQSR